MYIYGYQIDNKYQEAKTEGTALEMTGAID